MKTDTTAPNTPVSKLQLRTYNRNYRLRKSSRFAPKAALLAIAVVSWLALSPTSVAQCSYIWAAKSTILAAAGSDVGPSATLEGISLGIYIETFTQSGSFTLNNLQASYNGIAVPPHGAVELPQSPMNVGFTGIVPATASLGQTAKVTMALYDILGQYICGTTFTVEVGTYANPPIVVTAPGWDAQGAGIAIADINGNGTPDMILMTVDNPPGQNYFRYEIGWDLDENGKATWWENFPQVGGATFESQGGGMAITDLNGNGIPDIVFMTIDHPGNKANAFHYTVCWDVDQTGNPAWCQPMAPVGGLGWDDQGGGIAFTQLDSDPRPEMVLMGIDHPGGKNNSFWYTIGWNVNSNGVPTHWSPVVQVDGVGWEAQGGGLTFVQLDGDPRPEMVLMAIDPSGTYRYKVGWNIGADGLARSWSSGTEALIDPPLGNGLPSQGGGVAFANLEGNSSLDMILMALEHPESGNNQFHYRVRFNVDASNVLTDWP
jgi:hypothetical protein